MNSHVLNYFIFNYLGISPAINLSTPAISTSKVSMKLNNDVTELHMRTHVRKANVK